MAEHGGRSSTQRRERRRRLIILFATVAGGILFLLLLYTIDQADDPPDVEVRPRRTTTTTAPTSTTSPLFTVDNSGQNPASAAVIPGSCTGEAILEAVGVERFQRAGVTFDEFARAPSLASIGVAVDDLILARLERGLASCHTISIIAEAHIRGLRVPVSAGAVTCVGESAFDQPDSARAVAELYAGTNAAPYGAAMSAALQACSGTVVELMINAVESQLGTMSASQRACIERETLERIVRLSDAIGYLLPDRGETFYEVPIACR